MMLIGVTTPSFDGSAKLAIACLYLRADSPTADGNGSSHPLSVQPGEDAYLP